ncbi:hypothetical protein P873_05020 [Arenimonas composti TR7-09 = DSM 18010]|uniref:Uncharacterized protein n=1 Tax=Arenimonas composti TR7-09 = DSM 18010 TaxID=1121013 RepID=A0A091BJL3_9GAMM|nr:hypothetical protein P873_05020 [Arenimonas composti TR7-09 = DSM 18010]
MEIGAALMALPLETPDRSAWPRLAERIAAAERARAPRRRWPFALAAAAVLALVALMPRWQAGTLPSPAPSSPVATAPASGVAGEDASLAELMSESARLEHLLAAMGGSDALSASATLVSLEFDDRLARLDTALADPSLDAEDRRLLWRHRVALLRDYAGLQGTAQWLAAEGRGGDGELVAVF